MRAFCLSEIRNKPRNKAAIGPVALQDEGEALL